MISDFRYHTTPLQCDGCKEIFGATISDGKERYCSNCIYAVEGLESYMELRKSLSEDMWIIMSTPLVNISEDKLCNLQFVSSELKKMLLKEKAKLK